MARIQRFAPLSPEWQVLGEASPFGAAFSSAFTQSNVVHNLIERTTHRRGGRAYARLWCAPGARGRHFFSGAGRMSGTLRSQRCREDDAASRFGRVAEADIGERPDLGRQASRRRAGALTGRPDLT